MREPYFEINENGVLVHCKCNGNTRIVIPKNVRMIGRDAFIYECPNAVQQVIIPEEVSCIEKFAFAECESLVEVRLPRSLKVIRQSTFHGCHNLRSINLENIITICNDAFLNCHQLANVDLSSAEVIYANAFDGTQWEANTRASNGLLIGNGILINARGTSGKVVIPESIKRISPYAFLCEETAPTISELIICSPETEISANAFFMGHIDKVILPKGLDVISEKCFTASTIKTIDLPNTITDIYAAAFCRCERLERVEIPASVENIEIHAFAECENLRDVVFNKRRKRIVLHEEAFVNCPCLRCIKLPKFAVYSKEIDYIEKSPLPGRFSRALSLKKIGDTFDDTVDVV